MITSVIIAISFFVGLVIGLSIGYSILKTRDIPQQQDVMNVLDLNDDEDNTYANRYAYYNNAKL